MSPRLPASALPGDAGHSPAPRAPWTVGTLRAAIAGIPDNTPLVINATDFDDPGFTVEQVITDAGFGTIDWGDGHGPEQGTVFALDCEIPDGPIELRAGRARVLTAPELLTSATRSDPDREPVPRSGWELEAEP